MASHKATFQQLTEFFPYLQEELKLTVFAIKGYNASLNCVFILHGMSCQNVSQMEPVPGSEELDPSTL